MLPTCTAVDTQITLRILPDKVAVIFKINSRKKKRPTRPRLDEPASRRLRSGRERRRFAFGTGRQGVAARLSSDMRERCINGQRIEQLLRDVIFSNQARAAAGADRKSARA
jgi:hypothetical protein